MIFFRSSVAKRLTKCTSRLVFASISPPNPVLKIGRDRDAGVPHPNHDESGLVIWTKPLWKKRLFLQMFIRRGQRDVPRPYQRLPGLERANRICLNCKQRRSVARPEFQDKVRIAL